jgi:hypothetical protein
VPVGVVCVDEPLHGLRLPAGGEQVVGVGVEQPRAPRVAADRVELGDLEPDDGGVGLAQVAPGSRSDDEQLDPLLVAEVPGLRAAGQVESTLGTAEGRARCRP